jgi:hypothetical protein
VLTDYERLPEFVPNLESCERLPSAVPGRSCIRQRGCSQSTLWRIEAEAVLEIQEKRLPLGCRELQFRMLEGDFKVSTAFHELTQSFAGHSSCSTPGDVLDSWRGSAASVGVATLCVRNCGGAGVLWAMGGRAKLEGGGAAGVGAAV